VLVTATVRIQVDSCGGLSKYLEPVLWGARLLRKGMDPIGFVERIVYIRSDVSDRGSMGREVSS
jgi:hypothetical protein